jgi:tetratricopeptide (TPR) repeat protein
MTWFGQTTRYDRGELLAAAGRARARGRRKKASALYLEVLRVEPENDVLRKRIALLLAQSRQLEQAAEHYRIAAQNLTRKGFAAQASGIYQEALTFMPREASFWLDLAQVKAAAGSDADAVSTLRKGRVNFRGRRRRADAVRLLARAHDIDPGNLDVGLDLARQLRKQRDRAGAIRVLDGLAERATSRDRRRILAAQLRAAPTAAHLWRWLVGDATPDAAPVS